MTEDNTRAKIMIVDDMEINRFLLKKILSDSYDIECANDGIEAIGKLTDSAEKPNLLLLDIMMPGIDGLEVLTLMKNDPVLRKIPVIFITSADNEIQGLRAGAVDYIAKPFQSEIVKLRVANHLELSLYREKLEQMVERKANELISTKERFQETLANLIEYRSLESGQHVKRTKDLTRIVVMQMLKKGRYVQELTDGNYEALISASPLHDIGKIGISDSILLKPGKLTHEEFDVVKTHTTMGAAIVKSLMANDENDPYLKHCYDICLSHHERWDGNGYPNGIAGRDIPISARIVASVDVYDALVTERCYKKAYTHEETLRIVEKLSGNHFDPVISETLLEVQEQFKLYEKRNYSGIAD